MRQAVGSTQFPFSGCLNAHDSDIISGITLNLVLFTKKKKKSQQFKNLWYLTIPKKGGLITLADQTAWIKMCEAFTRNIWLKSNTDLS